MHQELFFFWQSFKWHHFSISFSCTEDDTILTQHLHLITLLSPPPPSLSLSSSPEIPVILWKELLPIDPRRLRQVSEWNHTQHTQSSHPVTGRFSLLAPNNYFLPGSVMTDMGLSSEVSVNDKHYKTL